MTSGAHKRRLSPRPPRAKCKQCGVEKSIEGRADGLGKNCGGHKDAATAKQADWEKAHR
jgi:hypothetical protein